MAFQASSIWGEQDPLTQDPMPGGLQSVIPVPQIPTQQFGFTQQPTDVVPTDNLDKAPPFPRPPEPMTDMSMQLLEEEEIDKLAGHPGFIGTVGEMLLTREGLVKRIPFVRHYPESTRILKAYGAFRRMKKGEYISGKLENSDIRTVVQFMNETRVEARREENRTWLGQVAATPIRSFTYALEFGIVHGLGSRLKVGSPLIKKVAVAKMGAQGLATTQLRRQLVLGLNKFIGTGGEKLLQSRLRRLAARVGVDGATKFLKHGSWATQQQAMKQAQKSLAGNVAGRLAKLMPTAQADVANLLLSRSRLLRATARSLETAIKLPLFAGPALVSGAVKRQLQNTPVQYDDAGNLVFGETQERIADSVWKNSLGLYFEYLFEYSGRDIAHFMKWPVGKHIARFKLAQMTAKIPGGQKALIKLGMLTSNPKIARGLAAATRISQYAAEKAIFNSPLEEMSEEWLTHITQTAFGIADDGTPWSSQMARAMAWPVTSFKEVSAMTAGFALLPVAGFVRGTAMGVLSTEEAQRVQTEISEALHGPDGRANVLIFRDLAESEKTADVVLASTREFGRMGLNSSLLGTLVSRITGWDQALARPGSFLDALSKIDSLTAKGKHTIKYLQDQILKAPEAEAKQFLRNLFRAASDNVFIEGLKKLTPSEQAAYQDITSIGQVHNEIIEFFVRNVPDVILEPMRGFAQMKAPIVGSFRELDKFGQRIAGTQTAMLDMTRLIAAMDTAQRFLNDAELSPAQHQHITQLLANWKALASKVGTEEFFKTVNPNVAVAFNDKKLTQHELAGTGPFVNKKQLTQSDLIIPEEGGATSTDPVVRQWLKKSRIGNIVVRALDELLKKGDIEVYLIPHLWFSASNKREMGEKGYTFLQGQLNAVRIPQQAGRAERIYVTPAMEGGFDLAHELGHRQQDSLSLIFGKAIDSLMAAHGLYKKPKSTMTDQEVKLFNLVNNYFLQLKSKPEGMGLQEYIKALAAGNELPTGSLDEDMSNALALYMGYGENLSRRETLDNPRLLLNMMKETDAINVLRFGLEQVIQGDPVLSILHLKAVAPDTFSSLEERFQPKPSELEPKSEVKSSVITPEINEMVIEKGVFNENDSEIGKDRDPSMDLSMSKAVMSTASLFSANWERLLNANRMPDGELNQQMIAGTVKAMGYLRLMTKDMAKSYNYLVKHNLEALEFLGQPADVWEPVFRDIQKEMIKQEELAKITGPAVSLKQLDKIEKEVDRIYADQVREYGTGQFEGTQLQQGLHKTRITRVENTLDSTYPGEYTRHEGRSTLAYLIGQNPALQSMFKHVVFNKDTYMRVLQDPSELFEKYPDSVAQSFWAEHLGPTLRTLTYKEFTRIEDGIPSIASVFFSEGLPHRDLLVLGKEGPVSFRSVNHNLSKVARKIGIWVTQMKIQAIFDIAQDQGLEARDAASAKLWGEQRAHLINLGSPRDSHFYNMFEGKLEGYRLEQAIRTYFSKTKVATSADLRAALRMLEVFLMTETARAELKAGTLTQTPLETLDWDWATVENRLSDYHVRQQLTPAIQNFMFAINQVSRVDWVNAMEAASVMHSAFVGDSKNFGILPAISALTLSPGETPVLTRDSRGQEARITRELSDILGPGEDVHYVTEVQEAKNRRREIKKMTPVEIREVIRRTLTMDRGSEYIWIPIGPRGSHNSVIPFIKRRRYNSGEETVARYTEIYNEIAARTAVRDKENNINFITPIETFKAEYAEATGSRLERAHLVMYSAELFYKIQGNLNSYSDFLDMNKRSTQTEGSNRIRCIPTEGREVWRQFAIKDLELAVFKDKRTLGPVLENGDHVISDGGSLLTDYGARLLGLNKNVATSKHMITGQTETGNRFLVKYNSVHWKANQQKMDPAIFSLMTQVEAFNRAHPEEAMAEVTFNSALKVRPAEWMPLSTPLTWGDDGQIVFDSQAFKSKTRAVDVYKIEDVGIVGRLIDDIEARQMRMPHQALSVLPLKHTDLMLRKVMFPMARLEMEKLKSLDVPIEDFIKNIEDYIRPESSRDQNMLAALKAGVKVWNFECYRDSLTYMLLAKIRSMATPMMFGVHSQDYGIPQEFVPQDARITEDGYLIPAQIRINVKGGRQPTLHTFVGHTDNHEEALNRYLWDHRNQFLDLFQSTIEKGEGRIKRELLPFVRDQIKISKGKASGIPGSFEYSFILPGQITWAFRNPVGESTVAVVQLSGDVGPGDAVNLDITNENLVYVGGRDMDGDTQAVLLSPNVGVEIADEEGRIVFNPKSPAEAAMMSAFILAHDGVYPGDSPSWYNPEIDLDPLQHRLSTDYFERIAKSKLDSMFAQYNRDGWNSASAVLNSFGASGFRGDLAIAARNRQGIMLLLPGEGYGGFNPNREVIFTIPGIPFQFIYGPNCIGPRKAALLRRYADDVYGLVADANSNWVAPALHLNKEGIGLVMSVLLANSRLEYLEKRTEDTTIEKQLQSIEGTLELLQTTLFDPATLEKIEKIRARKIKIPLKYIDPASMVDLVYLTDEMTRVSNSHDSYHNFSEARVKQIQDIREIGASKNAIFDIRKIFERTEMGRHSLRAYQLFQKLKIADKYFTLFVNDKATIRLTNRLLKQTGMTIETYKENILSIFGGDNPWTQLVSLIPAKERGHLGQLETSDIAKNEIIASATIEAFLDFPEEVQHAILIHHVARHGTQIFKAHGHYLGFVPLKAQTWLADQLEALTAKVAAPAASVITASGVKETLEEVARINRAPAPKVNEAELPGNQFSANAVEIINHTVTKFSGSVDALHKEVMEKFAFEDQMRLRTSQILQRVEAMVKDSGVPMLSAALNTFLNYYNPELRATIEPGLNAKIRTSENTLSEWAVDVSKPKDEQVTTRFFDEDAPTVREIKAQYDEARKTKPHLASWFRVAKEASRFYEVIKATVNEHGEHFTEDNEPYLADVRIREKGGYVPLKLISPYAEKQWDEVSEQLRNIFREIYVTKSLNPNEAHAFDVHSASLDELAEAGQLPASRVSLKISGDQAFRELSETETDKKIEELIESIKEHYRKVTLRIKEDTQSRKYRSKSLDEHFKDHGEVFRDPNFFSAADSYALDVSQAVARRRIMTYMAQMIGLDGTPAVFFLGHDPKQTQGVLTNKGARTMFENWRARMRNDGLDVPVYDSRGTVWDNLEKLEAVAQRPFQGNETWFDVVGYRRVDFKRGVTFKHAWVMDGAPRKLLAHITSRGLDDLPDTGIRGAVKHGAKALIYFNQFTKQLAVAVSGFFAMTLTESFSAGYGLHWKNPLINPIEAIARGRDLWTLQKDMRENPKMQEAMLAWQEDYYQARFPQKIAGLEGRRAEAEHEEGPLDQQLARLAKAAEVNPIINRTIGTGARFLQKAKKFNDHVLWETLQPGFSFMTLQRVWDEIQMDSRYTKLLSTEAGIHAARRELALVVNQAFGGIHWRDQIWATPIMRDVIRCVLFAPNWTFANLQLAGVPDVLQALTGMNMPFGPRGEVGIRKDYLLSRSWPAFTLIVLAAFPAVVQGAIYAAFGDPDEDDQPYMWMNEEYKELSIDITPIHRVFRRALDKLPGVSLSPGSGTTERRRVYLRWGKSGYEILNWYKNPTRAFLGKSSLGAKTFWEQLTGRNTAGWDMPWTREHAYAPLGGLFTVDGKLLDSRLGYIAQKFIPMSVLNLIDPNRPASFFAPTGLGVSSYRAEERIADVLQAYGDEGFRYALKGHPEKIRRLETLVRRTLDAAWVNGYDPKQVMANARALVRAKQNAEFFAILERKPKEPNLAKLEEVARKAKRTDGTYKPMIAAVKKRYERRNRRITPRQRQALAKAWAKAHQTIEGE